MCSRVDETLSETDSNRMTLLKKEKSIAEFTVMLFLINDHDE